MKRIFLGLLIVIGFTLSSCCSQNEDVTQKEWKGSWISAQDCQDEPNSWLIYRYEKELTKVPSKLMARIGVDSKYWMWINGEMVVFEGGLKRGPAPEKTYYDVIDIAPYLKKGKNSIAILHWYFGKDGFSHKNSGKAGLIFDAQGKSVEICSNEEWKCEVYQAYSNTEAPYPNYRLPESNIRYDAQKAIEDWYKLDSSAELKNAKIVASAGDAPFGELVARPIPMWKDYGVTDYKSVEKSGDTLICKLPYNCHITPYLKVNSKNGGDTIHIITDNYQGGSENNVRAEYITKAGEQEYESLGWMNGHYVWYIIPEGVEVIEVKYRETGYNTEFSGSFECNDPFFNELWKRSARTLYITMRDTYMDCPDRERAQWWGDAVNELGEAFYALSPSSQLLAKKGIYELVNWQRENGTIYSPVPSGNWGKELPLQMLASVGWYGFYTQYFFSGDDSFIADVYDRVHRYLHEVWQLDEDGMVILRPGEWNWGDWGWDIDMRVLTNCWYYLALKGENEFAKILGKADDITLNNEIMSRIKANFDAKFWNGEVYRSEDHVGANDDRAQAMAVVSGLANEEYYPQIIESLKKEYHASPYMEKYVLEALYILGEDEFALDRMKERYAKMLGYTDYTTLFEGWGIGAEGFGGGTINHAWSGGPLTMMSQKVCGISPTTPGFKKFRVAPQMGYLTNASATMVTSDGSKISVDVVVENDKTSLTVSVPKGYEAELVLPNGTSKVVKSGTHTLSE